MITADEIFARLEAEFDLSPASEPRGSAPAELFQVNGGPATVGVIASVTRPFCGDCDRVRLTADGQVRNCLFAREESDLRGALRAGASDEEIAERWVIAMRGKRAGSRHRRPDVPPARPADVGHRRLTAQLGLSGAPAPGQAWPCRGARRPSGSCARPGSRPATPGARRTPARSCVVRACAAWGCSRAAPRSPVRDTPSPSTRVDLGLGHRCLRGNGKVPDGHGGRAVRAPSTS